MLNASELLLVPVACINPIWYSLNVYALMHTPWAEWRVTRRSSRSDIVATGWLCRRKSCRPPDFPRRVQKTLRCLQMLLTGTCSQWRQPASSLRNSLFFIHVWWKTIGTFSIILSAYLACMQDAVHADIEIHAMSLAGTRNSPRSLEQQLHVCCSTPPIAKRMLASDDLLP